MRTKIIRIGNSQGVRIPKALLEESGLGEDVELKASRGAIRIVPAQTPKPKQFDEAYLLGLGGLSDWNRPEEDEAWAHLQ